MPPKLRLSRLRDLGFSIWDPIGLLGEGERWEHKPFADEYDGYLRAAAGMLRRGKPEDEVIGYLVAVETEHMGLGQNADGALDRATRLVRAISEDDALWTEEE